MLAQTSGDVVLCNDDVEVLTDGWTERFAAADADIVGVKVLRPDRTVLQAGGAVKFDGELKFYNHLQGAPGNHPEADRPRLCPHVSFAFAYLTRRAIDAVGEMDPLATDGQLVDCDWCLRALEAGLRILYLPAVAVVHREGMTQKRLPDYGAKFLLDRAHLWEKWRGRWERIPALRRAAEGEYVCEV
jgi:GT2 family glycosyltransferase